MYLQGPWKTYGIRYTETHVNRFIRMFTRDAKSYLRILVLFWKKIGKNVSICMDKVQLLQYKSLFNLNILLN